MADLGADVIKVEEPGRGDYVRWTPPMVGEYSAMHAALNRNKRSITLNLKADRGPELLARLVEGADVLVESFRPGVMDRLGVGYERLSKSNPGLVYAAITGFGQDGPYRDRVGHDINYVAIGGILDATGEANGPPVLPAVQIADLAGAMMAVVGILGAVYRRQQTGTGEMIDVSMLDSAISWLALHAAPWLAGAEPLQRGAGYLNGGFPFYCVYQCADGKFVSVGALEPQFWKALVETLGLPELIGEQFAPEPRRGEIRDAIAGMFRSKSRDEWVGMFADVDACVAPVNDMTEMAADPQVLAREMIAPPGLGIPLKTGSGSRPGTIPAPGLGEHNREVYAGAGLTSADFEELSRTGVI